MFNDYYKILGISLSATPEEVKRAYRLKAKLYHPDVNSSSNANQLFALINEAYEVLADEDKRFRFDLKYKYRNKSDRQPQADNTIINKAKTKKQDFHYDWNSYNQARYRPKDMRETHPVLFHLLFLFGMFVGFLLSILAIVGTYLQLWPFIFIVIVIPGLILVVEGFNGIMGKKTRYDKLFNWILKRFKQ
jgi:hypothetical protein